MNKRIDFSILGGFPATQDTFNWMQDSYRTAIISIAKLFGDKFILWGCEITGGNVSSGAVVINGELLPFVGGVYAAGDEVVVVETAEPVVLFQDNSSHAVYFTKVARIGSPGGFLFTDLVSIGTLKEFYADFQALVTAFTGHTHDYDTLTNLPAGKISYVGSQNVGDIIPGDMQITVAIPDQGTNTYKVFVTVVGNDTDFNKNNDFSFVIIDKQNASFKIGFREYATNTQNLRVEYMIIK